MERVARVLVKYDDTPFDCLTEVEKAMVWAEFSKKVLTKDTPGDPTMATIEFIEWEPEEDNGN